MFTAKQMFSRKIRFWHEVLFLHLIFQFWPRQKTIVKLTVAKNGRLNEHSKSLSDRRLSFWKSRKIMVHKGSLSKERKPNCIYIFSNSWPDFFPRFSRFFFIFFIFFIVFIKQNQIQNYTDMRAGSEFIINCALQYGSNISFVPFLSESVWKGY